MNTKIIITYLIHYKLEKKTVENHEELATHTLPCSIEANVLKYIDGY